MTDNLIERIDEATYAGKVTQVNLIEMGKLISLISDCKVELLAKDAEIERLKDSLDSVNFLFNSINTELQRIEDISVEEIAHCIGLKNTRHINDKKQIAQAIKDLIEGK